MQRDTVIFSVGDGGKKQVRPRGRWQGCSWVGVHRARWVYARVLRQFFDTFLFFPVYTHPSVAGGLPSWVSVYSYWVGVYTHPPPSLGIHPSLEWVYIFFSMGGVKSTSPRGTALC